ncbi:MAG: FAD-dependent oxidoreductase [Thermodesulfobacteriota bacterium]
MTSKRFVVIGGDAAGMSAASLARRRRPDLGIEVFEMGEYTSYGACGLPYYIAGWIPELDDLISVTPWEFMEKRGIQVHLRHRAQRLYPDRKVIEVLGLEAGRVKEVAYDDLLIATGAEPLVPPGVDTGLEGVFTLRGLPQAEAITRFIREKSCRRGLVVGTGYIGMEMAEGLAATGLEVTVVGRRPLVLPAFEEEIAEVVAGELKKQEVNLRTGAEAAKVERVPAGGLRVTLTDGGELDTDLVVIGAGVRPRNELAVEAGLAVGVKKAIAVDRRQRTSAPGVWAAGDCAEAYHRLLGRNAYVPLALHANRQGRIVGGNVVGLTTEFPGVLGTAICKVFDLTVARTGLSLKEARDQGYDAEKVVVQSGSRAGYYPGAARILSVLIVDRKAGRPWGAQMVGADGVAHRINTWAAALAAGLSLEDVYGLDLAYAPPFSQVWDPVLLASKVALKGNE